ncbi:aminoglycoside phosphotransferase family protein [Tenggerimyces flavus]|uniref:Aminoglycoside phosphotransferase family protein n=1 Tax=Tenggerimyces flavus TaxID=1708749 RepID=A0ABV7YKP6_9ACTN|nr:aminoglycoside phosphotransferase family protein [Tenggerimyces flavus]
MHDDELEISADTVRALVDDQFPQWRSLPIASLRSQGTVNAIFRLGDLYTARFPLRPEEPAQIRRWLEEEADAARELAGVTRFRTPEPVAIGEPGAGYPLPWSVQTWLDGTIATDDDPSASVPFALDLAEFVQGVRAMDTRGRTFRGQGRGGDLRDHEEWVELCIAKSTELLDEKALRAMWLHLRDLPREAEDVMSHGDLIPGNVLVANGRLTGVLDVGGLGAADPALDLVGAWHLLEDEPRAAFRDALGSDDLEWERGRGWAFEQAMGVVWYYVETNPPMARMGMTTMRRLLES